MSYCFQVELAIAHTLTGGNVNVEQSIRATHDAFLLSFYHHVQRPASAVHPEVLTNKEASLSMLFACKSYVDVCNWVIFPAQIILANKMSEFIKS